MKGSADAKLAALLIAPPLFDLTWAVCPPQSDTFLPGNIGAYASWPKLTDLFPWQHSGSQFKRLWPIGESREILEKRWHRLVNMPSGWTAAFVETDARVVSVGVSGKRTLRATGIVDADSNAKMPRIERYYYRTFDRQWALVDERLADRLRPALVAVLGPQQIFATTLMSKTLGTGPAISVTDLLPDMDVFCNRGAKSDSSLA